MDRFSFLSGLTLRRGLIAGAVVLLLRWIAFFDSHSLLKRVRWHQEYEQVTQENERLRDQIQQLEKQLDEPLSDDTVERIAREEYGMKRPGETVFRVEEK
jgi:cell division protein FtsB